MRSLHQFILPRAADYNYSKLISSLLSVHQNGHDCWQSHPNVIWGQEEGKGGGGYRGAPLKAQIPLLLGSRGLAIDFFWLEMAAMRLIFTALTDMLIPSLN